MLQKLLQAQKAWLFFVVVFFVPVLVSAFVSPGNPSGYVNDFAGVLSSTQKSALENKLVQFNASTTNEIAVVTVKSLGGDYIEHYAVELFKAWGIGTKKNDNGVLLLIAIDDRQMRIEVGYGLEGSLTDSISAQIIRDDLTPSFKQGDYYTGVEKALNNIISVTKGEYKQEKKSTNFPVQWFEVGAFLLFFLVQFFSAIFGRSKSWWAGGVVGGLIGGGITFTGLFGVPLLIGGGITIFLILLGLLFDYLVSKSYAKALQSGSSVPWWIGGKGFGGRSGSSSSFGGFSGGSSGGGGASGRW